MGLLDNRAALVTGGANGIGKACVEYFAREGAAYIMVVDIDERAASAVAGQVEEKYGTICRAACADIARQEDIARVFETYKGERDRLDILLNGAGVGKMIDIDEITEDSWNLTMNINLRAAFLFAREALRMMKPQRYGRIINMASQAGKTGGLVIGIDYAASKGGLLNLTKSLAKLAAPYNITVNSVAPGLINTGMTTEFGYDPKTVPLGRIGSPEEVADATLFLASDMSRYMTGACIDVNGGISMW